MMKTIIQVYLRDKGGNEDYFITPINLPVAEAINYYLGKWWNMGIEDDKMMQCYDYRICDTPREVIAELHDKHIDGLYYVKDGERHTPRNIYFGIDMAGCEEGGERNGYAWTHLVGGLYPVFLPSGERLRDENLCNVSAYYRDGVISDFYRQ